MARKAPQNLIQTSLVLSAVGFVALTLALFMHYREDYVGTTVAGRILCLIPAVAAVALLIVAMIILWRGYRNESGDDSPY